MGHNSLETQNGLYVPNDAAWNYLPNAFYRIKLSQKLFKIAFGQVNTTNSRNIEKIKFGKAI